MRRAARLFRSIAAATALFAGAVEATTANDAWDWLAAAAPIDDAAKIDGRGSYLVQVERRAGRVELWSEALDGGRRAWLSGAGLDVDRVQAFLISPDGRLVAFTAARDRGPLRLFAVEIGGGRPRRLDDDRFPGTEVGAFAFRPDSRAVAFVRQVTDPAASAAASIEIDTDAEVAIVDEPLGAGIFSDGFETGDTSRWSDTTPGICPAPTSGPTSHSGFVADGELWTAAASPHVLTGNVIVGSISGPPVTLTIAPCAELRLAAGVSLTVRPTGTLVARGTPEQRIAFNRHTAAPFGNLWVQAPGVLDLAFADITGGDGGQYYGVINIEGSGGVPPVLDHVKVIGSAGYGVRVHSGGVLSGASRDLVIRGSGATPGLPPYPLRFEGLAGAASIPSGSYTGNVNDVVQLIALGPLQSDATYRDRGVPYQVGGDGFLGQINVGGGPSLATLTLESGVELRFSSSESSFGGLFVNGNGRLIAAGTATRPIVFTGAGEASPPGSWEGISFTGTLAAGNLLDHVRIEAAGAHGGDLGFGCPPLPSNTDGALKLFTQPSAQFLFNSVIADSSYHGIYRAWTGFEVDFKPTNTFVDVARCEQVLPHPPPPGTCPDPAPCS